MNQKQAMLIVNTLMFGLQRGRSVSSEQWDDGIRPDLQKRILEDLLPWLQGAKGEALLKAVQTISDRGHVEGMELYNLMFIIHRLAPHVNAIAGALTEFNFPEPDISWIVDMKGAA